jgi:transcriptional regulator with XRE-family HTH domain
MINEALRMIRVTEGYNQTEAAQLLGISNSYLSELEAGKKSPTIELLNKYAAAFNLPASRILFFSENMGLSTSHQDLNSFFGGKIIQLFKYAEKLNETKQNK